MMTDPVSDMITRIRNCNRIGRREVPMPYSKLKFNIAEALKRNGFVSDVVVDESSDKKILTLRINVAPNGQKTFTEIKRISKPGCRVYKAIDEIKPIRNGLGSTIVSTSKGVMSDREAKAEKVGGECLFSIC